MMCRARENRCTCRRRATRAARTGGPPRTVSWWKDAARRRLGAQRRGRGEVAPGGDGQTLRISVLR